MSRFFNAVFLVILVVGFSLAGTHLARGQAQLDIVEIMFDTVDSDGVWEWVEVLNSGTEEINFANTPWLFDDDDGQSLLQTENITSGIVPVGTRAVLFNGFDNDAQRFQNAWIGNPNINLIPVNFFPGMNQGGDRIGLWKSLTDYDSRNFANTVSDINYGNFPGVGGVQSGNTIYWDGSGSSSDIANTWNESASGVDNAFLSVETGIMIGGPFNSTDDAGSPGVVPGIGGGSVGSSAPLVVTEIMYSPASSAFGDEQPFEWVEVYNNSGAEIDFSTTPYVFSDDFGGALSAENMTSGSIPAGGVAILHSADGMTDQQMQDAWGAGNNYIQVSDWSSLFNGGETLAFWDDLADHQADKAISDETVASAVATQFYDNGDAGWPEDDMMGSIYLLDLGDDPTNAFNWDIHFTDSGGDGIAFNALQVDAEEGQEFEDHPGGDLGSPGLAAAVAAGVPGDYNNNGTVDAADYAVWLANLGAASIPNEVSGVTPGVVDLSDYEAWKIRIGNTAGTGSSGSIPEPSSILIALLGLACLGKVRRQK